MEKITCPYCEVEVRMNDVDNEGGACPECGAIITGSLLFKSSEGEEDHGDDADLVDPHLRYTM